MESTGAKIIRLTDRFAIDAANGYKSNKSAAQRARKLTREIDKLLKQYRKESIK